MALKLQPIERKHPYAECEGCPLYEKPCAKSLIPDNPIAAVVARSPGWKEAMTGEPFTGPSGLVLNHLLEENGIKREEVLLTNVVLCAPPEGQVPPDAIKRCAPRLAYELEQAQVPLVIAAGSEAVHLLIGKGAIDRYRGYRITGNGDNGRTLIATNNPALVLRDDATFPNLRKDFKRAFHPIPQPSLPKVEVIEDATEARSFIGSLRNCQNIACDLETRGGLSHRATIVSMQFAINGNISTVLGERMGLFTDRHFIENCLRTFFESRDHTFIWHNGKFDVKILRHTYGIGARIDEDTMLLSYACDERTGETDKQHGGYHKLEYLLSEEFGWPDYEPESVKAFKKTGVVTDYDELHTYAGRDVAGTYQLFELLSERVRSEEVERPYRELLLEGSEACSRIEVAGFHYDRVAAANKMDMEIKPELESKKRHLRRILDNPIFNPASPTQVANVLYHDWKLVHEMRYRPDKDESTDEAALNELIAGRFTSKNGTDPKVVIAFAKELLRFRKLSKQASTYIVGLIEKADKDEEGRIFTDLLLHGTTSGRLSSRNPNLQNITRTRPDLPDIRSLFLASPGRQIVQADYAQAELRCIAWFSQDKELLRIYQEDLDLHNICATNFYGEGFTSEQRSHSKNMNFGVAYGQSAKTFQEKHDIPEHEAQRYIDWWWANFSGVREWKKDVIRELKTHSFIQSPYGRKRRFYLITQENKNATFREAVNFYPQSTAGDFTLRSVILLAREIDWKKAAIVNSVHDSIVGDVKESYIDEYKILCEQIMTSRPKDELQWQVPFKIDIGVGPNWGAAK